MSGIEIVTDVICFCLRVICQRVRLRVEVLWVGHMMGPLLFHF